MSTRISVDVQMGALLRAAQANQSAVRRGFVEGQTRELAAAEAQAAKEADLEARGVQVVGSVGADGSIRIGQPAKPVPRVQPKMTASRTIARVRDLLLRPLQPVDGVWFWEVNRLPVAAVLESTARPGFNGAYSSTPTYEAENGPWEGAPVLRVAQLGSIDFVSGREPDPLRLAEPVFNYDAQTNGTGMAVVDGGAFTFEGWVYHEVTTGDARPYVQVRLEKEIAGQMHFVMLKQDTDPRVGDPPEFPFLRAPSFNFSMEMPSLAGDYGDDAVFYGNWQDYSLAADNVPGWYHYAVVVTPTEIRGYINGRRITGDTVLGDQEYLENDAGQIFSFEGPGAMLPFIPWAQLTDAKLTVTLRIGGENGSKTYDTRITGFNLAPGARYSANFTPPNRIP